MRQTLLLIQECNRRAMESGRAPTPHELGDIVISRLPTGASERAKYCRELGEFISAALGGVVLDYREWGSR